MHYEAELAHFGREDWTPYVHFWAPEKGPVKFVSADDALHCTRGQRWAERRAVRVADDGTREIIEFPEKMVDR